MANTPNESNNGHPYLSIAMEAALEPSENRTSEAAIKQGIAASKLPAPIANANPVAVPPYHKNTLPRTTIRQVRRSIGSAAAVAL